MIDKDRATRRLLRNVLEPEGYHVLEAEDGSQGLSRAAEQRPDLIILDIALPDMEGPEVLLWLREWSQTPVLVLSERNAEADKVAALDNGANDYLTKPFGSAELLARLRALQRALRGAPEGPLLIEDPFTINLTTHKVTFRGQLIPLTPTEEALFYVLVRYAGKVVTTPHLMRSVWGARAEDRILELRVQLGQLRKKLEAYGPQLQIKTERGIGYSLCVNSASRPPDSEGSEPSF